MDLAYFFRNKVRVALLLFCVMGCILLIRILEDKSVESINEAFVSMYKDRLVPATDLYFVGEQLHAKERALSHALLYTGGNSTVDPGRQLRQSNIIIDSLLVKYSRTYLVKAEQQQLQLFKEQSKRERQAEAAVLTLYRSGERSAALKLYETEARNYARQSSAHLSRLIAIQHSVADELISDSNVFVSGTRLYSFVQTVLAIVIGAMIVSLLFASKTVNVRQDKYKLN
ncbi:MCP four helix bundle domain-containing protein [Pedobacter sp. SYP-B3415]|uniref:MCP four helix bundle domain-containing protein n=1 Tax=Pedobacter sp. SYP-B3415 TaxID=2496641 RepID=UPI00101DA48C|nr:MCP four helix bundle domain-containing protein [Pedobacter sp. SYP-B3415]